MEALTYPHALNQLRFDCYSSSKRKRSKTSRSEEEEWLCLDEADLDLARNLMMLANGVVVDEEVTLSADKIEVDELKASSLCFKCTLCEKEFCSYQALGGHKASHRKSLASSDVTAVAAVVEDKTAESVRVHECLICHKQFPTGQALGGHKRRHYEGSLRKQHNNLESVKSLKTTTSNSGITTVTSSNSSISHHGFDLNLNIPDMTTVEELESQHPAKKPREFFF